jgi:hypothetical protein
MTHIDAVECWRMDGWRMLNNNAVCNGYVAKGYCLFCDVLMLKDDFLMVRNAF